MFPSDGRKAVECFVSSFWDNANLWLSDAMTRGTLWSCNSEDHVDSLNI